MRTTTMIKFLKNYGEDICGKFDAHAGDTFTGNEFIAKFGTYLYDEIRDTFCDFHDNEKVNGKVSFWCNGMHVEVWDEEVE